MAELAWSRRNEMRLRAMGGIEVGAGHYPLFVTLHSGWLVSLALLAPPHLAEPLLLVLFLLLQPLRLWVIYSLGRFWTTRIITIPGAPLVRRGPYRWCRHPNYMIVTGEVALLPLAFGETWLALAFTVLNLLLLRHRIRIENEALVGRDSASD